MTKMFLQFFLIAAFYNAAGQQTAEPAPVICHAELSDAFTQILQNPDRQLRRLPTSNIEVSYTNFPDVAKIAFEQAVSIWEEILITKLPIKINAKWESIDGTTLAFSGASRIYRNTDNLPYNDVWYVASLAEAIGGRDLNNGDFDINVTLNSNINWSFSTSGAAFSGRFDLITVVLHEIAHGLGFSSSMKLINDDTEGQWGQSGFPFIYDVFLLNNDEKGLTSSLDFVNPSTEIRNELISDNLFFTVSNIKFSDSPPKIFCPNPFKSGASISHLDESTYPNGTIHSLMSPSIRAAEVNHVPGELILSMLNQMGWPVNNLENAQVLATDKSELEVLVYPNPSLSQIAVAVPIGLRSQSTHIKLLSTTGKVVLDQSKDTIEEATFYLPLDEFPAGVYILSFQSDLKTFTRRIVKY
ncbi:MAG: hypothetical protein ACI9IP_002952 [Arcticibacterium sp.]|jgi:hypothetical protein